jgi:Raf kinase inhibitor-like YbhB/YbcL family protein
MLALLALHRTSPRTPGRGPRPLTPARGRRSPACGRRPPCHGRRSALELLSFVLVGLSLLGCGAHPRTPSASSSAAASGAGAAQRVNPYRGLPNVPRFQLTSTDVTDGTSLPAAQYSASSGVPGGSDRSPQLSWAGYPATTKSFVVTMFDPDAPTGSGFWHWAVMDVPVSAHSLPSGAGSPGSGQLPPPAVQLPNDAGLRQYVGAAPPAGSGLHHYFITVTALDVAAAGVDPTATPAVLTASIGPHTVGRASLVPTAQR